MNTEDVLTVQKCRINITDKSQFNEPLIKNSINCSPKQQGLSAKMQKALAYFSSIFNISLILSITTQINLAITHCCR